MNLLKTSFYTSISTGVTFICGFIVAKVVAVKIGPPGVALVGQYQNLVSVLIMLGTASISVGVVKLLANQGGNPEAQSRIIATAYKIVLYCSAAVGLSVALAAPVLSKSIFHNDNYSTVFILLGATLIFLSGNAVTLAVFNGLKNIKSLTISNIAFSVIGIIATIVASHLYDVKGVLMATSISAAVLASVNIYLLKRTGIISFSHIRQPLDKGILRGLSGLIIMSVFSSLMGPISQFLIRTFIITRFSETEAGYWQGMTKISDYYLTFITAVLSVYYLPRLSEIQGRMELRKEIFRGYKIILPVVAVMAFFIAIFRHYVIIILYSPEFLPMKPLFTFQMVGDFIKIGSWLLGYLMWAKAMVRTFIATELFFTSSYCLLSIYFIKNFGLIGTTYAFCFNYTLYFIVLSFIANKYINSIAK